MRAIIKNIFATSRIALHAFVMAPPRRSILSACQRRREKNGGAVRRRIPKIQKHGSHVHAAFASKIIAYRTKVATVSGVCCKRADGIKPQTSGDVSRTTPSFSVMRLQRTCKLDWFCPLHNSVVLQTNRLY